MTRSALQKMAKMGILVEMLFGLLRHFRTDRTPDNTARCRKEVFVWRLLVPHH